MKFALSTFTAFSLACLTAAAPPPSAPTQIPGSSKLAYFTLVTAHSGSQYHLLPVNVFADGTLTVSSKNDTSMFQAHLDIGSGTVQRANTTSSFLSIANGTQHLQFVTVDHSQALGNWSTHTDLSLNGAQNAMVCPNDLSRIIWAKGNVTCDGGVGVQLAVSSEAFM